MRNYKVEALEMEVGRLQMLIRNWCVLQKRENHAFSFGELSRWISEAEERLSYFEEQIRSLKAQEIVSLTVFSLSQKWTHL